MNADDRLILVSEDAYNEIAAQMDYLKGWSPHTENFDHVTFLNERVVGFCDPIQWWDGTRSTMPTGYDCGGYITPQIQMMSDGCWEPIIYSP